MNKILTALVIVISYQVNAQGDVPINVVADGNFISRVSTPESALGSAYIPEEYSPARIINFDNKIYSARYNALNKQMEVLTDQNATPIALDIVNNNYEIFFISLQKTYRSFTYNNEKGITKRGFLVVLSDENGVSLLKEENITYIPMTPAVSSYDKDRPAKFKREDDIYYLKLKDDSIVHISSKTKEIPESFPNYSKEISNFLKKNKVKTKNEEDIIKLANFIGTL